MAIDITRIIQAVMEGSHIRDAKGIIPVFGVYLSLFAVPYYNRLSFDFEREMADRNLPDAENLLVAAAQECGYTTFHGIRNSWEWEQIVNPMIESKEDQIEGFCAVAMGFGWGDLEIVDLSPEEQLVLRASDSYEATGFIREYGAARTGKCHMLRGVTAAFMDLLYGEGYPHGCYTFSAVEEKCRAKGDPYCEFTARRSHRRSE